LINKRIQAFGKYIFGLPEMNKKRIPSTVVTLGFVSLFTDIGSEMIYPLIPIYVALLGSGAVALGIIEGLAESTSSLLKLVTGILSDKIRRRRLFILAGYGLSGIARPLMSIAAGPVFIAMIRVADRIGKGIRTAPRDALIADSVDEESRGKAFGFHRAMDHLGAVVGPAFAILTIYLIIRFNDGITPLDALKTSFAVSAVFGILAAGTIALFLREQSHKTKKNDHVDFSLSRFDRNFIFYLAVTLLFTLGNSSDAFLLFRAEEIIRRGGMLDALSEIPLLSSVLAGFPEGDARGMAISILLLPLLWSFFHIIKSVFSTPFGALSDKIGRKKVLSAGWIIYAFVYAGFACLDYVPEYLQLFVILVLFAVYAVYCAMTEGAQKAFVADIVPPESMGRAFGLFNFSIGLGALPASIIFGIVYRYLGAAAAFGSGVALALLSAWLLANFVMEKRFFNDSAD
jgi:MFS family permease